MVKKTLHVRSVWQSFRGINTEQIVRIPSKFDVSNSMSVVAIVQLKIPVSRRTVTTTTAINIPCIIS